MNKIAKFLIAKEKDDVCDIKELLTFVKNLGVKATKAKMQGNTATVFLNQENAKQLLKKVVDKYHALLHDGYGTESGTNYKWSFYRWQHPEYGLMGLHLDRRTSIPSRLLAYNEDSINN